VKHTLFSAARNGLSGMVPYPFSKIQKQKNADIILRFLEIDKEILDMD
jgi:hypothetical protein